MKDCKGGLQRKLFCLPAGQRDIFAPEPNLGGGLDEEEGLGRVLAGEEVGADAGDANF